MTRRPLAELDDWELVYDDQDLRGQQLLDATGAPIGTVREMIVDTDEERVDAIVLDNGAEYAAHAFRIRDGRPVLLAAEPRGVPERAVTREAPVGTETIPLREEELRVRKRAVPVGEVEIHKEVVAEQRTLEVPVTREEVIVERHPVEPRPADRPIAEGEAIRIPVREEQVEVAKRPVVREEIEIGKRQIQETEPVTGTVRREGVRIEEEGDVTVRGERAGTTAERWEDVMPGYRSRWQERYGTTGGRWEDFEPGYRYGWEMASRPEYRGRSWTEIEPEFRRDWEARYRDRPWDRDRDSIRDAWEGRGSTR